MRTLIAIVLTAGVSLGAAGCFSKPGYTGATGDGDGGVDAPGDVPVDPVCTPGDVPALMPMAGSFAKLSAGPYHTCGVDTQGRMWCWGFNGEAALGSPAMQPSPESGAALQVGTETGWTDVAVGDDHSCGVRAGVATCWGRNGEGQVIPSGSSLPKIPTALTLPVSPIASVYAGPRSTCARSTAGDVYCWGQVDYPDSGNAPVVMPTKLTVGTHTWIDVTIAVDHACAISSTNEVFCWGRNDRLQLGVAGGTQPFSAPVQKSGTGYTQISADEAATCAIRSGDLVCWGADDHGQLGDPAMLPANNLEVVVDSVRTWTQVELGALHACARATDSGGQVTCYGDGYEGALGRGNDSTTWDLTTPTSLANVAQITAGRSFSCAVVTGGAAYCWGSNTYGQTGTGLVSRKRDASRARLPVGSCEKVQSIDTGAYHTCALVGVDGMPGHAYCWGAGEVLQVDGTTELITENPVRFLRSDGGEALFTQLATGAAHTCGLQPDGVIQCWGADDAGELGNPSSTNPGRSTVVSPTGGWTYVAAGATTTCAIATGGGLYCWGSIPGETFAAEAPRAVGDAPVSGWVWESIEVGSDGDGGRFVIGVMRDGAGAPHVVGFGANCSLGSPGGTSTGTTPSDAPVELLADTSFDTAVVAAAAEAGGHACVLTGVGGVGTLRCWGPNGQGRAIATTLDACVAPTVMPGTWLMPVAGAASVAASAGHTIAINGTGAVVCWGENYGSQCGRASSSETAPEVFSGVGARYAEVSTSRTHTCAIDDTRAAVWCWGRNDYAQLGDGARDYFAPHPAGITFP